jgi:integrase
MKIIYETITNNSVDALTEKGWLREAALEFERRRNGRGVFWANLMVNGQRIHRVLGYESPRFTVDKARRALEILRFRASEDRLRLPKGRKIEIRFAEAAKRYVEQLSNEGGRDLAAKNRRLALHLVPFFAKTPLAGITQATIQNYKKKRLSEIAFRGGEVNKPKDVSLLDTTKPGTINRELAVLRHLLNKAVEWGWINALPCKVRLLQDDARRTEVLTPEECDRLLEAARNDDNEQIYPFIRVALDTGMRHMEILRLRRDRLDLSGLKVFIDKAKAGARMQPITAEVADCLRRHIATLPTNTNWVFPSPVSRTGHTGGVRKAFRRVARRAGLDPDRITPHTLRHTACSHLLRANVDIPTTQVVTGHKTVASLLRYFHADMPHVQGALNKLKQYRRARPKRGKIAAPTPPRYYRVPVAEGLDADAVPIDGRGGFSIPRPSERRRRLRSRTDRPSAGNYTRITRGV